MNNYKVSVYLPILKTQLQQVSDFERALLVQYWVLKMMRSSSIYRLLRKSMNTLISLVAAKLPSDSAKVSKAALLTFFNIATAWILMPMN
jgi:hypothetical protein